MGRINYKELFAGEKGVKVDEFGHIAYNPKVKREKPKGWDKWQARVVDPATLRWIEGYHLSKEAFEESLKTETIVVNGVEVFKPTDRFIEMEQALLQDDEKIHRIAPFAALKGADIKALEDKLLSVKEWNNRGTNSVGRFAPPGPVADARRNFARLIPWADINKIRTVVIEQQEPWQNYEFAKFFWDESFIEKHQEAVINGDNLAIIRRFARDVEGADIEALQKATEDGGGFYDWGKFARDVEGADLESLYDLMSPLWRHYGTTRFNDVFDKT